MTIPRVVHQVWLGGETYPLVIGAFVGSAMFEAMDAGWDFRVWNEEVLQREFGGEWPQLFSQCCHLSQASNVARYLILERHGGLYLDTDVEVFRLPGQEDFRDFRLGSWIAGTSEDCDPNQVNPCVLASEPGGAYVARMLDRIRSGAVDLSRHMSAGPLLAVDAMGTDVGIWPAHVWHGRRDDSRAPLGHHYGWGHKFGSFLRRGKLPPIEDFSLVTPKT